MCKIIFGKKNNNTNHNKFVVAGGVAANKNIRKVLEKQYYHKIITKYQYKQHKHIQGCPTHTRQLDIQKKIIW